MQKEIRICLVVDNPLRDLEGLVLLARTLALKGASVYLVPMYDQGFAIPAIRPHFVLLNYLRLNNLNVVRTYAKMNIKIGVLDTEGIARNGGEEFANSIKSSGHLDILDMYCFWGSSQRNAVVERDLYPENRSFITGCPRVDFAISPWRTANKEFEKPGYVLINTNFPIVNPRFSASSDSEVTAAMTVGVSKEDAVKLLEEGRRSFEKVKEVVAKLATDYPDETFILRPHPFENINSYSDLEAYPNVQTRQEGKSIDWLAYSKVLIHQNCTTSIEAAMLGVPALSLEWFNSATLSFDLANDASIPMQSYSQLSDFIEKSAEKNNQENLQQSVRQKIEESYHFLDGKAHERVSDAIFETLDRQDQQTNLAKQQFSKSLRSRFIELARILLGRDLSLRLVGFRKGDKEIEKRKNKEFSESLIEQILQRLDEADPQKKSINSEFAKFDNAFDRRLAGKTSILIRASN